jgi:hypothetical protein
VAAEPHFNPVLALVLCSEISEFWYGADCQNFGTPTPRALRCHADEFFPDAYTANLTLQAQAHQ